MMDGPGGGRLGPKVVGAPVFWVPLCRGQVGSIARGHQAAQVRVPTGWEEAAPPVEMETHHGLIIIIIQCLWAAVGSPSKREGSWSALGPSWMLLPSLAPAQTIPDYPAA